jgi:hypothetical protein
MLQQTARLLIVDDDQDACANLSDRSGRVVQPLWPVTCAARFDKQMTVLADWPQRTCRGFGHPIRYRARLSRLLSLTTQRVMRP